MRTRFSQRTNRRQGYLWWGTGVLVVALILVLTRLLLPDFFVRAAAPLWGAGDSFTAGVTGFFEGFGNARTLAAKNKALALENAKLALENRTLEERIADLTTLIGTSSPSGVGVLAGVIARPPTAPYDTFILSAGTGAGVRERMEAFAKGGIPIGIVEEVTTQFSRVRLFSSPRVATDAWVGEGRIPLTLRGTGGGAFTASVSQGSGVQVGDLVYLPGPGAVPVGRVANVKGVASDLVVTLAIAPVVNPFSVVWVELRVAATGAASSTLTTAP